LRRRYRTWPRRRSSSRVDYRPATSPRTLAGYDVREYRQEDVRATFALAGQESHLFDSTIRENVRLARPAASDAELREVLRRVGLDEWVTSLPDGLETVIGEDGTQLSGGQRQRITVALHSSPILPSSCSTSRPPHVDPDTAEALIADVLCAAEGRTVLLITHRPEGLDLVDEVVTLV